MDLRVFSRSVRDARERAQPAHDDAVARREKKCQREHGAGAQDHERTGGKVRSEEGEERADRAGDHSEDRRQPQHAIMRSVSRYAAAAGVISIAETSTTPTAWSAITTANARSSISP